jgi:hypothetical protein
MHRIAIAFLVACGSDEPFELGIIELHNNVPMIDVPSAASIGQPIRVGVTTYGSGCSSPSHTFVEATTEGADIRPLDHVRYASRDGEVCTSELLYFAHEATLTFDTPGTKTIRIHGRRVNANVDAEVALERSVAIQ